MDQKELVVKLFKALGHPVRYQIVKFLLDQPKCVCDLNENVEFSQSNLSQHLKILREAGILKSQKQGLRNMYSIANDEIQQLIKTSEKIISEYIGDTK